MQGVPCNTPLLGGPPSGSHLVLASSSTQIRSGFALPMNESRDSIQQMLVERPLHGPSESRLRELETHVDRLYERLYDYWEYMEKLAECVASPPPLPLKYK